MSLDQQRPAPPSFNGRTAGFDPADARSSRAGGAKVIRFQRIYGPDEGGPGNKKLPERTFAIVETPGDVQRRLIVEGHRPIAAQ